MRRAASIAALGPGAHDGEHAIIEYAVERARLTWHQSAGVWLGEPHVTIRLRDLDFMQPADTTQDWTYLSLPVGGASQPWGWKPRAILEAQSAYSAGLVLQESLSADHWTFNPGWTPYRLAVVWYAFENGDSIGPAITPDDQSPGRNVGVPLDSTVTRRIWATTGWVDSPIDAPSKPHLAPHLYTKREHASSSADTVEYVLARWRWKGVPS